MKQNRFILAITFAISILLTQQINAQILIDCVSHILVDYKIIDQNFDAHSIDELSSRAQHANNSTVNYEAPNCISFENGFEIESGTDLYAEIMACNITCPCDGISCNSNQTCINGICVNNTTLQYGSCDGGNDTTSILGLCDQTLSFTPTVNITTNATDRIITANNIPDHMVGLFGMGMGSLNPNPISPQNSSYTVTLTPAVTGTIIQLLGTSGPPMQQGPQYSFGVLLNGVEVDPIAAEPWPHQGAMNPNTNWEWNLDALGLGINLGLDCNYAHVQPTGKYHYHGKPTLYLESLNIPSNTMTLIGYAADGFPIYYKYAYENPNDSNSAVIEMQSSYRLKKCERPGDGITAPCGNYDGTYSNDWEYLPDAGTLDECNGRTGTTPEFPGGTYYYLITDAYPSIPRCFVGTPSNDFEI